MKRSLCILLCLLLCFRVALHGQEIVCEDDDGAQRNNNQCRVAVTLCAVAEAGDQLRNDDTGNRVARVDPIPRAEERVARSVSLVDIAPSKLPMAMFIMV